MFPDPMPLVHLLAGPFTSSRVPLDLLVATSGHVIHVSYSRPLVFVVRYCWPRDSCAVQRCRPLVFVVEKAGHVHRPTGRTFFQLSFRPPHPLNIAARLAWSLP